MEQIHYVWVSPKMCEKMYDELCSDQKSPELWELFSLFWSECIRDKNNFEYDHVKHEWEDWNLMRDEPWTQEF